MAFIGWYVFLLLMQTMPGILPLPWSRSFPKLESNVDVTILPEDIKIEVFRSSGPGGQHMQKSSTAVRITHLPTGIVVASQSERSQLQNKTIAFKILEARLFEKELERRAEEKAKLKGKRIEAGLGQSDTQLCFTSL